MNKHRQTSNSGMALMMALFFMSIAIIVLAALTTRWMNERLVVDQFQNYAACFQGAESALIQSRIAVESGKLTGIGIDKNWTPVYKEDNKLALPDFDSVNPVKMESMPGVEFIAWTVDWGNDNRDNNGDGVVDDVSENWMYSIHAAARYGGVVRTLEAVYAGADVNVWRNAIFAGSGQAGGLINGNVSIHGSVHLLGDNLIYGITALAALDLSGTSLIHNNHVGMPAGLAARIPPLPKVVFQGETVSTLEAKLRVKKGLVGTSGNSEIGEPQIFGNAVKETMDGTYVNDGWTGTSVIPDGGRGDPKNVFSDNGWDELYDLGDKVSLPVMKDDWRDPVDGSRVLNPSTGTWYTHEEYFSEVLLADPTVKNDGIYSGSITLDVRNGPKFYWNATKNILLTGSSPAVPPDPTDDYILFDHTTDMLRINGQIRINGNLELKGQGNDRTINYSGRAAILATGDVKLNTNLLSCNNANAASTANSFPVNNIFGIMAMKDMYVGEDAQLSLMGAFYAQGKIVCAKQSNVIGTFVSNYFDMGTNVPSIFQVPELADNLPMGMIGNFPILSMQQVSWREVGV